MDQTFALVNADAKFSRVDIGISALFVDLYAKNYIHIDQENSQLVVNTELNNDANALTSAQKKLLQTLAVSDTNIFGFAEHNPILEKAMNGMANILSALVLNYKARYLIGYYRLGYLLLIAMFAISTLYLPIEAYMAMIFMVIASIKLIVPTLLHYVSANDDEDAFIGVFAVLAGFVFGGIPLYGLLSDITDLPLSEQGFVAFYGAAIIPIVMISFCLSLVKQWTYGFKKDQVDNLQAVLEFKHFLEYTKKEEYALITPDLFEAYLPHAIIFEVDQNWLKLYRSLYPVQYNESHHDGVTHFYGATTNGSFSGGFSSRSTSHRSESNHRGGFGNSRGSGGSGSGGGGSSGGGSGGGGGGGR